MPFAEFLKLLGDIDFVSDQLGDFRVPPKEFRGWAQLAEPDTQSIYDEFLMPPQPGEQAEPLTLQTLCRPAVPGVYDVEWLAPPGTSVAAGDAFATLFRVSDGLRDDQRALFPGVVRRHLVQRNDKVIAGSRLVDLELPSLAFPEALVNSRVQESLRDFALAVNAVVKGYMGAAGQSGNITKSVIPVSAKLDCESGEEALLQEIVQSLQGCDLRNGDIVVSCEKIFAIAQGRLFPRELIEHTDPKTCDRAGRAELLRLVRAHVPDVDDGDLICADFVTGPGGEPMATAGVRNPNEVAVRLSRLLRDSLGVSCDVVISDTDTGLDVRETLIGTITLGATPLGATAGLVLYECMRIANAAEFCRGTDRNIPLVICRPHERRVNRPGLGDFRGYHGRLDARREALTAYA
jgi:F420-0:gamma-glutamyl ligase